MPVTATPIFIQGALEADVTISTANTNLDGTGTIADLVGTTTNGARVDRIEAIATGTTTAGVIRLFIHDATTWRLWRELPVGAAVPSIAVRAARVELDLGNPQVSDGAFLLAATYKIGVATHNAEEFEVRAIGGLL